MTNYCAECEHLNILDAGKEIVCDEGHKDITKACNEFQERKQFMVM